MTTNLVQRIFLRNTQGTSNKGYILTILRFEKRFILRREWGRMGNSFSKQESIYDYEQNAIKEFNKLVREKKRKGYQVSSDKEFDPKDYVQVAGVKSFSGGRKKTNRLCPHGVIRHIGMSDVDFNGLMDEAAEKYTIVEDCECCKGSMVWSDVFEEADVEKLCTKCCTPEELKYREEVLEIWKSDPSNDKPKHQRLKDTFVQTSPKHRMTTFIIQVKTNDELPLKYDIMDFSDRKFTSVDTIRTASSSSELHMMYDGQYLHIIGTGGQKFLTSEEEVHLSILEMI